VSATAGPSTSTTSDLAARLGPLLRERLAADVELLAFERLPGGASRESWLVRVRRGDGREERLVLRRDPPGHVIESSREGEFALLQAAAAAGVPVPNVRWAESDPAVLGAPFFVMDFVEGETIGKRLVRDAEFEDARTRLPEQIAGALARIHAIDAGAPALAFLARTRPERAPAQVELDRYRDVLRGIAPEPHPALELAIRWLGRRIPRPEAHAVVHGDFRMGNVIVGPEGLRAVLDWELSHTGDPLEDLGWFCVRSWRFGRDDRPAGGLCDRERFVAAYERARGVRIDRAAVRWWEIFGNLKWGVICIMQAQTFLRGVPNVELASLGRRTAEMEWELLELMEETR
jgi:aminoglycoside phosphotransferase (APT) family kinase protein